MRLGLITRISLHLMQARFRQTLVAAAGVMFGIGMFIALISFMTGLNQLLDGLILNRTPHVRLYNEVHPSPIQPAEKDCPPGTTHFIHSVKPHSVRKAIHNSKAIMAALRKDDRVIDVAPKITAQVFYQAGTIELAGLINGIDPDVENRLFAFGDYVVKGSVRDLEHTQNGIFIGKGIAEKMLLEPGDIIQVGGIGGDLVTLKVIGILQFGLQDIDNTQSFTSLATAQHLLGEPADYITDLQVKLRDITLAPALSREFARSFRVDAVDIQTANAQFETGSSVRSIISYAVGITLLIVAGFGIYNILNMMIYEKMDSIAILKATGFSGSDVSAIFLLISLIIGVCGGLSGLAVGFVLSRIIDHIPFETAALPTIRTFPVNYNPAYYLIGIVFSLATTYVAGWFPSRKAADIDPVIIIRGK